jgi:D-3-phosphoglycerate dehydrogenase
MARFKIVITDHGFSNIEQEMRMARSLDAELVAAQCKTPAEVVAKTTDADALLVQWAPITAEVIARLKDCKIIVRYGVGVDNVDLAAAKARGIPVCNVPDYCVDEVADHTLALALALARQLPQIHQRILAGVWKTTPDKPLAAFRDMTFATAGFGRIAQAALNRAKAFGFKLAAHDPFASPETFAKNGVANVSLDDLFRQADVLSLHCPLTAETKQMVNAARLAQMKPTAILINTSRGGLVDTTALAAALNAGTVAAAGLDVFETEPLPLNHPLRRSDHVLLTSHVAWFSERSVPQLQQFAAEEVARGLRGEPLKNQVNKPVERRFG